MTLQELNIRIATAGGLPSQANNAVKALIDSGALTLEQAMPILVPLRLLTPALISIQEWHDAQDPVAPAKPALPPGMAVADVASADDPVGHGTASPSLCTPGNWSYYQQHSLGARWADIFSGPLSALNAAIGANPGTIATAQQDPLVRDASGNVVVDLATFG